MDDSVIILAIDRRRLGARQRVVKGLRRVRATVNGMRDTRYMAITTANPDWALAFESRAVAEDWLRCAVTHPRPHTLLVPTERHR